VRTLETTLVTLAFTSWNTPTTGGIHFHKRPPTNKYIDAGNPMRLFLLHGFVSADGVGTYEF